MSHTFQGAARDRNHALFFHLSQNLLGMTTPDGHFQELNPAWEKVLGWSQTELIAQPWFEKIHPADSALTLAAIRQLTTHPDTPFQFETRFRHKDGRYCWLAWNAILPSQPDRDQSCETPLIYVTASDVTLAKLNEQLHSQINEQQHTEALVRTAKIQLEWQYQEQASALKHLVARLKTEIAEREQIETALAASEARIRDVAANIPGAIFQFCYRHGKWNIDYISAGIEDIMGISAEDVIDDMMVFVRRLHPDDFRHYLASVSEAIENFIPWHYEGRLVKPSGQVRWWQGAATPTQTAGGGVMFCGVLLDISDRKAAEAALQQANAALEAKVAERTRKLSTLIQQLEAENQERKLAETALQDSEMQLRHQADELRDALTQLQQTQSKLIQSEKMSSLGQLVAGVAHEINNPVNFIYGNLACADDYIQDLLDLVQLYQVHYPMPIAAMRDHITAIDLDFILEDLPNLLISMKVGADRIREIVQSLRTFSRLDEAEFKTVNLHENIDSTLMILQHRLKAAGDRPTIEIIKHYGDLPLVECYAGQLNQVFMNILANAIDAIAELLALHDTQSTPAPNSFDPKKPTVLTQPTIQIHTELIHANRVAIRIADNGGGMLPTVLERLFDPFFTTKPIGKGTGLGLSISYQIVTEKHNGSLRCSSEPGEGTEFVIEIPVQQAEL